MANEEQVENDLRPSPRVACSQGASIRRARIGEGKCTTFPLIIYLGKINTCNKEQLHETHSVWKSTSL